MFLKIEDLYVSYLRKGVSVPALRGVDLNLGDNICAGILGESGCGKSTLLLSILRLIPDSAGKIDRGRMLLRGNDILKMDQDMLRNIRGKDISMIFQDPFTTLNPVFTIGDQITEAIRIHSDIPSSEAIEKGRKLLETVRLPRPEHIFDSYPHQLSGGMLQRSIIAMALSSSPHLLLADEPTTALDVTVAYDIISLLKEISSRMSLSILFVTHDIDILKGFASRLFIMYAGVIVEEADMDSILSQPRHPYTRALLDSRPGLGKDARLKVIPGSVPDMQNLPSGCKFHPRCPSVEDMCRKAEPDLYKVDESHFVRCIKYA